MGMVRYNALFSKGEFALVIFCFADKGCSDKVDLQQTFSWNSANRFPLTELQNQIDAAGPFASRGTRVYVDSSFRGPSWETGVERNCYKDAGSTYNPDDDTGGLSLGLAQCFLLCAGDPKCNAITVEWLTSGGAFDNFQVDSAISCHRKNVASTAACQDSSDPSKFQGRTFSTFAMKAQ